MPILDVESTRESHILVGKRFCDVEKMGIGGLCSRESFGSLQCMALASKAPLRCWLLCHVVLGLCGCLRHICRLTARIVAGKVVDTVAGMVVDIDGGVGCIDRVWDCSAEVIVGSTANGVPGSCCCSGAFICCQHCHLWEVMVVPTIVPAIVSAVRSLEILSLAMRLPNWLLVKYLPCAAAIVPGL